MDNREKFNIKQMVDCEKQEPFYPVTHALAIKIIDNGEVKVLLDIISNILNFTHKMENFDPEHDLLTLGYGHNQAFPGDEGKQLSDNLLPVCNDINEAIILNTVNLYKLASLLAIINFVNNLTPNGTISLNENRAVTGGTIYNYIDGLLHGSITENNNKLITGGDVYEALSNIEDPIWETDSNHINSIKQKSSSLEELGLQVTNNNEVAIGKYNSSTLGSTLFSVGSGDVGDRKNSIEVTNDILNSLKIPYGDQGYVSILAHMRNALANIKHLTQDQLNKLEELINDKWKPSYSFSASAKDGTYLDNNTEIILSWNIKNSEGGPATILAEYTHLYKDNQEINNVPISSNGSYTISNYENYSFNDNGKSKFTYKLVVLTDELQRTGSSPKELTDSVTLYAPSYMFTSTNSNLSTIPDNGTEIIRCTSLESFLGTISISNSNREYIYIAIPTFTNILEPTSNLLPFKDFNTGFLFNLSNEYFGETTKTFNICSKLVEVNYKIVRSNQLLDLNTTWTIAHRNKQ